MRKNENFETLPQFDTLRIPTVTTSKIYPQSNISQYYFFKDISPEH